MPRSVVFFRNLNLGQGWAPTRPQLEQAYAAAGATDVVNVQSNGTLVFSAAAPRRATDAVLATVRGLTGYDDVAVVRSAAWVARTAAGFADLGLPEDETTELVLFDGARGRLPASPDDRLRFLATGPGHAVSSFRRTDGRGSNAARVVEDLTGVPATARGTSTILRLVERLA